MFNFLMPTKIDSNACIIRTSHSLSRFMRAPFCETRRGKVIISGEWEFFVFLGHQIWKATVICVGGEQEKLGNKIVLREERTEEEV